MKLSIEPKALSLLLRINNFLKKRNIQAYLVGGFVRDKLSKRETVDIDIAVSTNALEIASKLAKALGGKFVLLDEENEIGRIVLADKEAPSSKGQWEIDISTLKGGIEEDLALRDFTIDAMGIDLEQIGRDDIELIDPFEGFNDLRQGVIRVVSDTALESDPVRLLRAVRLAAELTFNIDWATESLIRESSQLITQVAGERIREELIRLLAIPRAGYYLRYLDNLSLLTVLIPELVHSKGVEQPKEHSWDVFDHSIETVVAVDFLLRRGSWEYADNKVLAVVPWSVRLSQHFEQQVSCGSTRASLLKLAALLHDVAKPETKTIDETGRMRFFEHAEKGAEVAVKISERLRFSTKEIKLVETMVRHHLRPGQMSQAGLPTPRAIYRYFRDTGDSGIDIIFLSLADHLAARGPNLDSHEWKKHADETEYILTQRFQKEELVVPPKMIDGHDLMRIFGLKPGPDIGRLLEAVREAQADGEVTTREQALAYVRDCLLIKGCK